VDFRQRTVKDEVSCTGIGLHSGEKVRLTIKPAPPDSGIKFIRKDMSGRRAIKAHVKNVVDTNMSTTIGNNGSKISTRVELDGIEVPIMDGSAAPFIFLIKSVGIKEQNKPKRFFVIKKPFKIDEGHRSISIYPSKELKISFTIDFHHPLLRDQRYELCFSGKDFIKEISRARTFGFLKDVHILQENGLAKGGSLDNAIVVDDFRIINEDGLRYKDEFVRHKILDFIGDLAILGSPIIGHFVVEKSGHSLNQFMLRKLIGSKKCWKELSFENPEECTQNSVKLPVFGTLEPVLA
jgi:UDP-3-O-[3-hydroxymyristoyl] N-acetylglucosamine deacetylase